MKYTLEQFKKDVIQWSTDRLIIQNGTVEGQLNKLKEECLELIEAYMDDDEKAMKDAIGDIAVVLINLDALQKSNSQFGIASICEMPVEEVVYSVYLLAKRTINDYDISWDSLQYIANGEGFDFIECCELAWNEIKDRKGYFCDKTKTFIKETDSKSEVE